jgi:hypothetical protein
MLGTMPLTPVLIVLYVIAGFSALIAIVQFSGGSRRWRERRRIAASYRALTATIFLLLALLSALGASALLGYRRLTTETVLAEIQTRKISEQRFALRVDFPDGSHRSFDINGDQWQLDARVIKWEAPAVMLGAPALYRLDRISGRYIDAAQEAERARSVVNLASRNPLDLLDLKQRFPQWLPFVDADYGSAAYLPLVDGGRYQVSLSPSGGLVARTRDPQTEKAVRETRW